MIRYIITFGFGGFTANSVKFVPTLGFTPGEPPAPGAFSGTNNSNYVSIGLGT